MAESPGAAVAVPACCDEECPLLGPTHHDFTARAAAPHGRQLTPRERRQRARELAARTSPAEGPCERLAAAFRGSVRSPPRGASAAAGVVMVVALWSVATLHAPWPARTADSGRSWGQGHPWQSPPSPIAEPPMESTNGWCGLLRQWAFVYNFLLVGIAIAVCTMTQRQHEQEVSTTRVWIVLVGFAFLFIWGTYGMWLMYTRALTGMISAGAGLGVAVWQCGRPTTPQVLATTYSVVTAGVLMAVLDFLVVPSEKPDFSECGNTWRNAEWLVVGFMVCFPLPFLGLVGLQLWKVVTVRARSFGIDQLESIAPVRTLTDDHTENTAYDRECPVCIEPFSAGNRIRVLPCRHAFHTDCIDSWIVEQQRRDCPKCRADIAGVDGSRLYSQHAN
eukprot:TRINITY_DN6312_c0_g1_i1.p1 TRINITY_DN6312_c0_g1~~TRINITY_DN6312_c0_g1_i1.p1  ORF type:complete len:417 (+),score=63.00 TRINITY_DN6312_c0_g1_i1:81-1253(+)